MTRIDLGGNKYRWKADYEDVFEQMNHYSLEAVDKCFYILLEDCGSNRNRLIELALSCKYISMRFEKEYNNKWSDHYFWLYWKVGQEACDVLSEIDNDFFRKRTGYNNYFGMPSNISGYAASVPAYKHRI